MKRPAAFDLLCMCLATDGTPRLDAATDWPALVRVASSALVATNLRQALADKGLTNSLPDEVRQYFEGVSELNAQRNGQLAAQLEAAACALNAVGIRPLALKGMANLIDGVYADAGERMIGDVDLLVPAAQLAAARDALQAAGFRQLKDMREDQHLPPMARPGDVAHVELHTQVHTGRVGRMLSAAEMLADATLTDVGSGQVLIPSATHRVLHNVIHTQIQDANYWRMQISLRQLCDLLLLCRRFDGTIDWAFVQDRMRGAGYTGALAHYLGWGETLLGLKRPGCIPQQRSEALARLLHRLQQRQRWLRLLANTMVKVVTSISWMRQQPSLALEWAQAVRRPGHLRLTFKRLGFRV